MTLLKSVADAQERYFMATGSFALDLSELDIEINWPPSSKKWWEHATQSVSNGTWVLETSVWQGQVGFVVGLISGKHQGGAFGATVSGHTHGAPYMSKREIECLEKTCCGTPYRNAAGNYCTKIFGGTFAYNDGGTRHYKLP
ncbi:MAG: hypothetical protein MJ053_07360 [Elusimicrobiaceae bacterium]|nr:hypothetical protein [Elusimicrobiaceae bacterium]